MSVMLGLRDAFFFATFTTTVESPNFVFVSFVFPNW